MIFHSEKKPLKRWHIIVLLIIIGLGVFLKLYQSRLDKAVVVLPDGPYKVLVAQNLTQQFHGWSKYKNMGDSQGMLFKFNARSQHTMVMRDMLFPLDIIWLDDNTVVDMAPNVPIEPGKTEEALIPYFARLPSTMVLEMASGTIAKSGLKIGDKVNISW